MPSTLACRVEGNANGIRYSIISPFGWFVDYYPSVFVIAFLADNNTECFTVTLVKYNTSHDVARTQYCQRSKWAVRKLLDYFSRKLYESCIAKPPHNVKMKSIMKRV